MSRMQRALQEIRKQGSRQAGCRAHTEVVQRVDAPHITHREVLEPHFQVNVLSTAPATTVAASVLQTAAFAQWLPETVLPLPARPMPKTPARNKMGGGTLKGPKSFMHFVRRAQQAAAPVEAEPKTEPQQQPQSVAPSPTRLTAIDLDQVALARYRGIRDQLLADRANLRSSVIGFATVGEVHESRFSSLLLSAALAEVNWGRVLLIDGTPPRSRDWRECPPELPRGLSEVLAGEKGFAELIWGSTIPQLDLLSAGTAARPALDHRPADLFEPLRALYRFVAVDIGAADGDEGNWLCGRCDSLYLICPAGVSRNRVQQARKRLTASALPLRGCIVVGAN